LTAELDADPMSKVPQCRALKIWELCPQVLSPSSAWGMAAGQGRSWDAHGARGAGAGAHTGLMGPRYASSPAGAARSASRL